MLTLENVRLEQGGFCLEANLSIPTGAFVSVIGPSGSGKSSLLAALAGFLRPTRGRILWQQQNLLGQAPGQRPVSILFQDNNLFPHLTLEQNVGLGVRPVTRLSRADLARVQEVLTDVGLADLRDRKPGALSGGQQSRGALARALMQDRPLMLLDEPFAALGPAQRLDMLDLVKTSAEQRGTTLLMVTHDPKDARRLGGLAIFVTEGVAAAPVPTEALLADPPEALRAYL